MKRLTLVLLLIIAVAASVTGAGSYTTPPGGSATGVPSSTQNSLVPNTPSTASGETVFLRNSSGQSFRGVVPYGSSFYYDRSSGSSVRRLSQAPSSSSNVAGASNYYDPRTGIRMDRSTSPVTGSNSMVNPFAPSNLPQTNNTQYSQQPRPISSRPDDLTRDLNRRINPDLLTDNSKTKTDINALAKEARQKPDQPVDPSLLLPTTPDSEINSNLRQYSPEQKEMLNRYEQVKNKMLEELRKNELETARKKSEEADAPKEADELEERSRSGRSSGSGSSSSEKLGYSSSPITDRTMDYLAAAEEYLNQGRFYKAADTYALAAVWQPENALAYAGQSWALFGAGEYMSSAYYLSKAIAVNPKIAEQKINISVLLRDRDVFENRLLEIAGSQERSKSGELAFLVAYILWQDGKTQRAQDMITLAAELMPQDEAVKTLLAVITAPPAAESPATETTVTDSNQIGK